jgi:hypothetical protein
MKSVVSTLRALVEESGNMTAAALAGNLSYRGNERTVLRGLPGHHPRLQPYAGGADRPLIRRPIACGG